LRHRVAIRFAVTGDLRFLSHRDMVRLFERAVSRANLPIRYSEGFNPRPRLWLPLPRSVGVASDDELFIVEVTRPEEPACVLDRLARQMPEGILMREAFEAPDRAAIRPVEATYRLELAAEPDIQQSSELLTSIHERIRRINTVDHLVIQRPPKKGGRPRAIDLIPSIVRIDLSGATLTLVLRIRPEGSARPAEMLELLGLDPVEAQSRLRRVAVRWELPDPERATSPEPDRPAGSD
jgi:radical SAM-linked protein